MDYVLFKEDMFSDGKLLFKKGKRYEILDEFEGKYAVSFMDKEHPTWCCTFPKDWDGFTVNS